MKTTNWIKCASVTYGGKPHFWKHRTRNLWVVWDRSKLKWAVENDDMQFSHHDSETDAFRAANNLA